MAQLIGVYDTIPAGDDLWRLQRDYGLVRDEGVLVIAPRRGLIDGASIPRPLWPVVGHPLAGDNKFWSVHHDAGYARWAVIVDLGSIAAMPTAEVFKTWRTLPPGCFLPLSEFPRRWWDAGLVQAMRYLKEGAVKQAAVWTGIRVGGWVPWRSHAQRLCAMHVKAQKAKA